MLDIHVDVETRSAVNLPKAGATRYAMDESTSVLCLCYAIGDGPVLIWLPGGRVPDCFKGEWRLHAHNAAFELAILEYTLAKYAFKMPREWSCTMIGAYQRNLPASLDGAAEFLKVEHRKDKAGRQTMLKMMKHDYHENVEKRWESKTRRKSKPISEEEAADGIADEKTKDTSDLIEYCIQDVKVERDISKLIPMKEEELAYLDRKINQRGISVDVMTINCILKLVEKEIQMLNDKISELTDGAITSGRQTAALTVWLRERGYAAESINKEAVASEIACNEALTPNVIEVLKIRQKISLGSIGKYDTMLQSKDSEYKVRDLIQFRGASQTGRYAGRRVQMQNLPRLEIEDIDIDTLISLFRKGNARGIRFLYGDLMWAAKQLIRPMLMSTKGMIVSDFAQIEARLVAWVAGDKETLASFEGDPYKTMAARIYKVPLEEVTPSQRFVGKTCVLGAGYQLGPGGFAHQLHGRGVELTEEEAQGAIGAYRAANPKTVNLWYELNDVFTGLVRYVLREGKSTDKIRMVNQYIGMSGHQTPFGIGIQVHLPSGRKLYYHNCKLVEGEYGMRNVFQGPFGPTDTYGGKLMENCIQAIANDLLNHSLLKLDAAGYRTILHVHDETVIENVGTVDVPIINAIMEEKPHWAGTFPLKAETKYCYLKRYTK